MLTGTLIAVLTGNDALENKLFKRILAIFRHLKLFKGAHKVFVVYAHDNVSSPLEAKEKVAKDFIQWFKEVRFDIHSDQSPCGYGPSIIPTGDSNAARNILANQFCLLPHRAFANLARFVILCGSNVLEEYMNHNQFDEYVKEMFQTFSKAQKNKKTVEDIHEDLHDVCVKYWHIMGNFHHVHTELALLYIRHKNHESCDIIPLLLNGDHETCFPSYIAEDPTPLRIEQNDQRSPHR